MPFQQLRLVYEWETPDSPDTPSKTEPPIQRVVRQGSILNLTTWMEYSSSYLSPYAALLFRSGLVRKPAASSELIIIGQDSPKQSKQPSLMARESKQATNLSGRETPYPHVLLLEEALNGHGGVL